MKLRRFDAKADRYFYLGTFPSPCVRNVEIENVPSFMRGLRAVFISDVHFRRHLPKKALEPLVSLIRSQKPDLLLLGGDYGEGEEACRRFFLSLRDIDCPLGKFGVPGNNDIAHIDALRSIMSLGDCALLRNESVRIDLPGGSFYVGGCDDHKYGQPETSGLFPDDLYSILISHFPVKPDCACDLMLSGHTHAGQIALGRLSPYTVDFEKDYNIMEIRGLHRHGEMYVLVGNGVGVSKLPIRMGSRPEIYLISFV